MYKIILPWHEASLLRETGLCCIAWCCFQLHHHAAHCSALLQSSHPSDWLWTWLDAVKKTSNQEGEAAAWPGGNMFSVGRWLDDDRFSAGVSKDVTSVARLRGGHRGAIKEGLVILVSRSPAGRLWSRALISTNRFLIRASQAPHPPSSLA